MTPIAYLKVPSTLGQSFLDRLRQLITVTDTTKEYTWIVSPVDPECPFVLIPVGPEAQSVLTPEEWASRLATMPVEFQRPLPF